MYEIWKNYFSTKVEVRDHKLSVNGIALTLDFSIDSNNFIHRYIISLVKIEASGYARRLSAFES